jgi:hypothetical protein
VEQIIWCGGFTKGTAQAALDTGLVDLIAFARPFVANPDLVARFQNDWPLAEADRSAFYTRDGEKGYTDFSIFIPHFERRNLVAEACNHPNCLVLPFRFPMLRAAA